jgi:hypothetical protein
MTDFVRQENSRSILSQRDCRANVQERVRFCQRLPVQIAVQFMSLALAQLP